MVYDQKAIEKEILEFWEAKRIPQRVSEQRPGAKPFFLLDGPPYANADAHVGHVKTTASKDIWSRYMQMKGFRSFFQPGFDCHGLPTEVMVEKELGVKSKQDIDRIGIDKFDAKCLEKVVNTEKRWMAYYRLLGAWRHYFEPYFTYKDYYIESGWWTLKQCHEKGLLYQGTKSVYWCPHCETTLSGYEVSDSYKDVQDPSVFVKFPVKGKENEFLLVWTTTPWTLPSNVAVAVHPQETYVRAKLGGEVLIFGEKRLAFLEEKLKKKFEVLETFPGRKIDGLEYEPLLDVKVQRELQGARKVILSIPILTNKRYKKHKLKHPSIHETKEEKQVDALTGTEEKAEFEEFVTLTDGTGLVHTAPGHGQTDNYVGKYYGLPSPSPVDEKGRFTGDVESFAGKFVKAADKEIIEWLEKQGKMLLAETQSHRVALCWRCKTQLVFRLSDQWYLSVEKLKDQMIAENQDKVEWLPDYGKDKFHNWLVDREDWCVSQQRYWGIPLPIWECLNCDDFVVIGSRQELAEKAVGKLKEADLTDLHRHAVDIIRLKCAACGSEMERVKDILNVWFDSGIAPWASLGYPFRNKTLFESMFPVNLVNESQDQIRGWFDSLMFLGVAVFGKAPYLKVAMNGWVLDEKGEKMSKSLGNVVPALDGIERLSADVIRMYYCYEVPPWEVQKFSFRTAGEVQKAFAIVFNTLSFYETYAQGVDVPHSLKGFKLELEDQWIVSRLESLVDWVTDSMESFERHQVGRDMLDFAVKDFSRTYIKLVRDRVSLEAEPKSRLASLAVMRYCLLTYSKLLAPISPFISEYIYGKLKGENGRESVHYEDWPIADEKMVKATLEEAFEVVDRITEAANSARQDVGLKKRWPLEQVVVTGGSGEKEAVQSLESVLARSLNAAKVVFAEKEPAEMAGKEFKGGNVFVPKKLSPEFEKEAFFRELVRAIQAARKEKGLKVQDRIQLALNAEAESRKFLQSKEKDLMAEVGASNMAFSEFDGVALAEAELGSLKATASFEKT